MSSERVSGLNAPEVEALLRSNYAITVVDQKRLGGEVDENVWVRAADGSEFLLKASAGHAGEALSWQQAVLDHLERTAPEIPVPRLVPARTGETMVRADVRGRRYVVRVLTWLPGVMLAELDEVPHRLLKELGEVAARLTIALAELPDRRPESHHWDIRNSRTAVDESMPFVEDEADRLCVSQLMESFDRALPLLAGLPEGVVHHDLNDFNVLALPDRDGRPTISGVLDVNDALHTIRVAELAIAVAYSLLRQRDPLEAAVAVVAGFHATAPLTAAELAVIFPLAAARLCVNATTWTRRTTESHHPYGRERMRHTWPALRKLVTISPGEAEQRLLWACGLHGQAGNSLEVDRHA